MRRYRIYLLDVEVCFFLVLFRSTYNKKTHMKCRVAWDKAIEVVIGKGKIVTWSISKQPETAKVSIRSQPLLRWIKTLPKQNSVKKYFISVFSPAARSNYSVLTAFKPPSLLYTTRGCM